MENEINLAYEVRNQNISLVNSYSEQKLNLNCQSTDYYRLLQYCSKQFENELFLDFGTHYGNSALILGMNGKNYVKTYDIVSDKFITKTAVEKIIKDFPKIDFIVQDAREINPDLISKAKLIFLDVDPHNGIQEKQIFEKLQADNFNGILICDDIRLNDNMRAFWSSIELPKIDVTYTAHRAGGTGAVFFDTQYMNIFGE